MSSPLDHFSLERPDRREQLTCGAGSQLEAVIEAMEMALKQLYAMRGPQEAPAAAKLAAPRQGRPDARFAEDWIELGEAAKRFGKRKDTLRQWCRLHGIGIKDGGRWLVSISKTRAHMGW